MVNWNYNADEYSERNFSLVPEGNHHVIIQNIKERVFNSGNEGFEITLEIPGQAEKLWYYLVLNPAERQKTNQRIGMFFDSFAIRDTNLSHYLSWIGHDGVVRVKHDTYDGEVRSRVAFCISRSQQSKKTAPQASPFAVKTPAVNTATINNFNGFKF